jgi:hypothetical protein
MTGESVLGGGVGAGAIGGGAGGFANPEGASSWADISVIKARKNVETRAKTYRFIQRKS